MPENPITVSEVTGWAGEQAVDPAHTMRWNRVLAALGVDNGAEPMTAADAQEFADRGWTRCASGPASPSTAMPAGRSGATGTRTSRTARAGAPG